MVSNRSATSSRRPASTSPASRGISASFESGFVSMRPDGQRRLYALKPEPFLELDAWLTQYRNVWEARLDRFGAALEKKQQQARRAGKSRQPR